MPAPTTADPGSKRRALAAIAGGIGITVAVVLGLRAADEAPTLPLDERCALVAPGDSRAEAMVVIGPEGYRPGCGATLPCVVEVLPDGQRFSFSCEGADCALLWVEGDLRCDIDTGPDGIVRAVELRTLPAP